MTPDAAPPQPEPSTPPDQDSPAKDHCRRNGFVAKKPELVRDSINRMLDDGVIYKKIVENLGPDGDGLTEDHIGTWARGGYTEYLAKKELLAALRITRQDATDINNEKAGAPAQDAARTIAAGQLLELLRSFNPSAFAKDLSENPDVYLGLINALARLSESEAACMHRRLQQSLITSKLSSNTPENAKKPPTESELKDITREIKLI